VLEAGGEPDIPIEALGRKAGGEREGEHLGHNAAPEPRVLSHEHAAHPAAAELALEGASVNERRLQLLA